MNKIGEYNLYEGNYTCSLLQVISLASFLLSAEVWSVVLNNNNNLYYLNLGTGSYNNNNKNNRYCMVPIESERLVDWVIDSSLICWKNKHNSFDAALSFYRPGFSLWKLIAQLGLGIYKPSTSICFIVMYPKPREIFAAHYNDRIIHHIVAPYIILIAKEVHLQNNNISFGNRKSVSPFNACLRILSLMSQYPDGYVCSFDIKSFFMSSDKDIVWRIFKYYEQKYRPHQLCESDRLIIMSLIKILIFWNPALDCERKSPLYLWDKYIPQSKSLFFKSGFPIGNYYSLLLENLSLGYICEYILEFNPTEFVDDFTIVVPTKEDIKRFKDIFDSKLYLMNLERHPYKVYILPVSKGLISWCGYTIYKNRIYLNNRTINNCYYKLKTLYHIPTLINAIKLLQVINSYTGMMSHCSEYNTLKLLILHVLNLGYSKYFYIHYKKNHLIVKLKKEFTRLYRSLQDYKNLLETLNVKRKKL